MFEWLESLLEWLNGLEHWFAGEYFSWKEKREYSSSVVAKVMGFLCRTRLLLVLCILFPLVARIIIAYKPDESLWATILNTTVAFDTILTPIAVFILLMLFATMFQLFETYAKHIVSMLLYGVAYEEETTNMGICEMFIEALMHPSEKINPKDGEAQ